MPSAWINGKFVDETEASISLRDTGLLHAAGVFTTMRAYGAKVFRLDRHLARLRSSCEALFVPLEYSDEKLSAIVTELLDRNELRDARMRLTVTRGASQQDPLHGLRLQPGVFLTATQLEPYPDDFYTKGMTVVVLDDQKLNPYDIQAGHKTLNYFSRLAALREANRRGAGEALWFNVHNYLQSGSISNVFLVKDGRLLTPSTPEDMHDKSLSEKMPYPKSAVLPGVTRAAVIELAEQMNLAVDRSAIDIAQLLAADEVFITNSIMQIMPVCRIERKAIANDKPGPITQKLMAKLHDLIDRETAGE